MINGLGYVRYIQGIQPNVPARTTFIDTYHQTMAMVCACTKQTEHTIRTDHSYSYLYVQTYQSSLHTFQPPINNP